MKTIIVLFFHFVLITTQAYTQHFTSIRSDEGIEILEGSKKVLFYQVRPKTVDGKYERAGYLHPLYDLNENILTEDMPQDHPYHHGIFWAWHQIILDKKNIADGWISENIFWVPVKAEVFKKKNSITLSSEILWKSVFEDSVRASIVKEETKIIVYKSKSNYRIIDFEIQLFALLDSLQVGGADDAKGYGGFCLRLKLPADISFHSENKMIIPQDSAVVAGPWMDFRGSFDGASSAQSGIMVFCKPTNAEHKQPWILRKEGSMQNVPYPGRTPVPLSKDGLVLRYRVIIHSGELSNNEIEKLYSDYIRNR